MFCEQSGKRRWPSRVGARRHQRALQRRGGVEGRIYLCPFCGGWHVTSVATVREIRRKAERCAA